MPSKLGTTESTEESVSVVLRRQVPIRFDEEPHAWLGGLPRLPAGVQWPRAKTGTPLHFVAQVDCTRLPAELWGGLGPREGWLLVFVDFEGIDHEEAGPIARVLHVTQLGPEAAPPAGFYWARRDVIDLSGLPEIPRGAQRQHFRKWPVDLVVTDPDTSEMTGSELYGAPEHEHIVSALHDFTTDRPMTWRGVLTLLGGLVKYYDAESYKRQWGGLLDYPEPDQNEFNKVWQQRRDLPEWRLSGSRYPDDDRLRAQMREERRAGWTKRAFKVLDEETQISIQKLDEYRTKLANAVAKGDEREADVVRQSVSYFEKQLNDRHEHRAYLRDLFAQYPSEQAFVDEIRRVGLAHLAWAQRVQDGLRKMLARVANMDPDAPVEPAKWDALVAALTRMKSTYWRKTHETNLLQTIEAGVWFNRDFSDVRRDEVLDCYASPPSSADGLDAETLAELEPRLRTLECEKPHKMGGFIDSHYDEPLKDGHVLLFQIASDAACGWICGDLGFVYVSISASDLKAGSFDKVRAWLEA
ncbi:MAG: DUF1963 domain-containing protein [Parvularculaceae bacterium]|nr:DUF1963 domain-containing protein [Parvularculaceae bacterium]